MLIKITKDNKGVIDGVIKNRGIGGFDSFYSENGNQKPIIYDFESLLKYVKKVKRELKEKHPMLKNKIFFDDIKVNIHNMLYFIVILSETRLYGDFIVNKKHYNEVVQIEYYHKEFFYSFQIVFDSNGDAYLSSKSFDGYNKEGEGKSTRQRDEYTYISGDRLNRVERLEYSRVLNFNVVNDFVNKFDSISLYNDSDYIESEKQFYKKYIYSYHGI